MRLWNNHRSILKTYTIRIAERLGDKESIEQTVSLFSPAILISVARILKSGSLFEQRKKTADVCGFLYNKDSLITEEWQPEEGLIRVPEGSGLGITLDYDQLSRLRADT